MDLATDTQLARLLHGDCLQVLKDFGQLVDAVVTDPPYHLTSIVKRFGAADAAPAKIGKTGAFARASAGFMGQMWDGGDIAQRPETWRLVFDAMKPGAHLVAFSGTRTYHRMACAIEDAGFEIRDQLGWMYGTGFPKSHDVSKGIDATKLTGSARTKDMRKLAMGDAYTPSGRGRANYDNGGGSRLNGAKGGGPITDAARQWVGWGTAVKPAWEPICLARKPLAEKTVAANVLKWGTGAINIEGCRVNAGRFPANVIHDGSDEVLRVFPATAPARSGKPRSGKAGNGYGMTHTGAEYNDDGGSAARFFYCAKASKTDRNGSGHPTVKPIALIRYLARLVTPPGGMVLDPFAGSGTTGQAALEEGFNVTLVEREAKFFADIERRIGRWHDNYVLG